MLRVFLVFLSLRLFFPLPAALACPSLCSLIAWCAPWSTRGDRRSVSVVDKRPPLSRRGSLAGFTCILLTRMSTSERRVGEGRFFFVSPPLSFFPFILFCLALCAAIACNCTRGVLALCVQYFVDASALRRSLERCRGGQRVGVGATAENTGATARKRGAFRTALLVRLRAASTSRVVEPCRRRAREEVGRHGRERDKCRAKT